MQKSKFGFIFCLVVLLITIFSGCTGTSNPSTIPVQTTIQSAVMTTSITVNPIVGIWQFKNAQNQVCTNTFLNDGSYTLTCTGTSYTVKGNWIEIRINEYQVTYERLKDVDNYVYQPETDTLLHTVNNGILYRLGKSPSSNPAATSANSSSIKEPLTLSGTGSNVHTIIIPASGTYLISASAIPSDKSYGDFSVYITDTTTGKGPGGIGGGLTFNELVEPSYQGTKSVWLTAGKYLISVEGHCKYSIKISSI